MKSLKIILYSTKNCFLCNKAREILGELKKKYKFEIKEIYIEKDPELFKKYNQKVPVIEIDGRFFLYYPFEENDIEREIKKSFEHRKGKNIYERNSRFYDFFEGPMEFITFKSLRERFFRKVFEDSEGKNLKVLEIGIGTGKNLPYYPENLKIYGCDLSHGMLEKAKKRSEDLKRKVFLLNTDAQLLGFKDNSFDIVITTFVFCSVAEPVTGLKEIKRVLKPDGKLFMLEHVRAENEFFGKIMDIIDPLTFTLTGAHINRKTKENLIKAGFEVKEEKIGGILRIFSCHK